MPIKSDSLTPQRIMQLTWGCVPSLVMEAAIRHRVFDIVESGPKTVQEVHEATKVSLRGLTAIMNVLVGLELLEKDKQSRYSLTPESAAFLVSSSPSFQGGMIRHLSKDILPKWLHLNEIVVTGRPVAAVNQEKTGVDFFEKFVADIFPVSYPAAQVLAKHLNLNGSGLVRVLDLAAGSGVWGIGLAQSSDRVRVTAVDWPQVLRVTRKMTAQFGVAERFSYIEGDLGEVDFGTNYAVATLGHILHSEGEQRSRSLLAKTFRALGPGGTIAIAEFLVNKDRTGPLLPLFFAVNMLVSTDAGDTYSFEEIRDWLHEAGFVNARLLEAPGPSPLILANKP
jgi:SAM-dependent methyltransferase